MKRTLPLVATVIVLPLALVLVSALAGLPARASAPAESKAKIVSVDYVLALMDEGIDQKEIVERIQAKHLAFRVGPGDIDRLRAAGAVEELIDAVTGEGAVLENQEAAPAGPSARPQEQGGADTRGWERPNRLGKTGEATAPSYGDEGEDGDDEGIVEEPDRGYYAYPAYGYYAPGYYNYMFSYGYGYPYYYYPYYPGYYYPYRSYYYYSSPYHHTPRFSYRTFPRGGSFRSAPRGGSVAPAPRGGGHRTSPRGSHH